MVEKLVLAVILFCCESLFASLRLCVELKII